MKKRIILIVCALLLALIVFFSASKLDSGLLDVIKDTTNKEEVIDSYADGIFGKYYRLANTKLSKMSLDEKIGQMLLVNYPSYNQVATLKEFHFGGYLFFEKDFRYKTENEVISMINELKDATSIPILTAVDEEGGIVVRISSNPNLSPSRFKSPRELYKLGGLDKIYADTLEKSNLLSKLGINLNLAPVVDVSNNPNDYMYERTIGGDVALTSDYAKTVINASKKTDVSYTLKHFPGYGNNSDTHIGSSVDNRSYEDLQNRDILPFKAGIEAGAEIIMISHNIVSSIDAENPASLSPSIHALLRDDLEFTGIIITDDIAMGATSNIANATVKAVLAGNDLIITTNYRKSINEIKQALKDGTISLEQIDASVYKIIAWKCYKGLITD